MDEVWSCFLQAPIQNADQHIGFAGIISLEMGTSALAQATEPCLWCWLLSYYSKAYLKNLPDSLHQHDLHQPTKNTGTTKFISLRRSASRPPIREAQQKKFYRATEWKGVEVWLFSLFEHISWANLELK